MHTTALFQQTQQNIADRELPAVFSPRTGHGDLKLRALPENVDQDQRVSRELLAMSPDPGLSTSAPEHFVDSFFVDSPNSGGEIGAASPAAMFLSSFSPMVAPQALPDDEGETISGYVLGPVIGRGGFSTIRRASSAQGGTVAVKIVRRSDLDKQEDPDKARVHLQHEASVWSSLNHEHILPLFSSFHTPYADFFITLYCPAGSLFDILKRDGQPGLHYDEAGRMFRQVVKGLRYMHEVAGYVHGDMKLENVLVDEMGVCRIGDFGMAKRLGESESDDEDRPSRTKVVRHASVRPKRSRSRHLLQHTLPSHLSLLRHQSGPRHRNSSPFPTSLSTTPNQVFQPGSLPYASPELLRPSTSNAPYYAHPAQDVWALGVMLYVMLTGRMPFADSFEPRLQMKILNGAFNMPTDLGRGATRVLEGSLEHSVRDRWTIAMVDEVACDSGWADLDDELPPPFKAPQPARSRSRARSTAISGTSAIDDADDVESLHLPKTSASRSRSRHSHPRHTSFHPYILTSHTRDHDWDIAVERTISSSANSECLSPVDHIEIRTPSSSLDRGSRERLRHVQTVSSSPSSLEVHLPSMDPEAYERGRKASPQFRSNFFDSSLSPVQALDVISPASSPYIEEARVSRAPRSLSVDLQSRGSRPLAKNTRHRSWERHHKFRELSLPSHDNPQEPLQFSTSLGLGDALGFITPSHRERLASPRSRSVGSVNVSIL